MDSLVITDEDVLKYACKSQNIGIVERIISEFNIKPNNEIFNIALRTERSNIVKAILDVGYSDVLDPNSLSNVFKYKCNDEVIDMTLMLGAPIDDDTLKNAISACKPHYIKQLLSLGAKIDKKTLTFMCRSAYERDIQYVLKIKGIKPDEHTLTAACESEYIDIVDDVIALGAKPDSETLTCACKTGNAKIVRSVLAVGARPNKNTLDEACWDLDIFNTIVKLGMKPSSETLTNAFCYGNVNVVQRIIEMGVKIENIDEKSIRFPLNLEMIDIADKLGIRPGSDALTQSFYTRDIDVINRVLAGAQPNYDTLNRSVRMGNVDMIKRVLLLGSNPTYNTLGLAYETRNIEIVNIISEIPDVKICYDSLFDSVCVFGDVDILQKMIDLGQKPDDYTLSYILSNGCTNIDIIKMAIDCGATPESFTLMYACETDDDEIVAAILAISDHRDKVDRGEYDYLKNKPELLKIFEALPKGSSEPVHIQRRKKEQESALQYVYKSKSWYDKNGEWKELSLYKIHSLDKLKTLINSGIKPDENTLMASLKSGDKEIIDLVISIGALPNSKSLSYSLQYCDIETTKRVIELGAVPNKDSLSRALKSKNIDIIKKVIEMGGKPDRNSLDLACDLNDIDMIKTMIELGAVTHDCLLDSACETGNLEIIKFIKGLNPNSVQNMDRMTFINVFNSGNQEAIEYVISLDKEEYLSYLDSACGHNCLAMVKDLINRGVKPGKNTLSLALETRNVDIVRLIIIAGGKPDKDSLTITSRSYDLSLVKEVIALGARSYEHTFHSACNNKDINVIKEVLKVEISQIDKNGCMPLEWQIRKNPNWQEHICDESCGNYTDYSDYGSDLE